jgi:hypothetical protein
MLAVIRTEKYHDLNTNQFSEFEFSGEDVKDRFYVASNIPMPCKFDSGDYLSPAPVVTFVIGSRFLKCGSHTVRLMSLSPLLSLDHNE